MLKKLHHYGGRGVALEWFQSYLTNRLQAVKLGQNLSEFQTITCGVPQRSVLGPLLVLIFINDIFISTSKVNFHLFADDTCIFCSKNDLSQLERNLNTSLEDISNLLKANKLTLNVKESNLLLINLSKNKKLKETINIFIEHQKLSQKEYAKYLGVYIDCHLSWDKHTEITNSKISKGVGILGKIREFPQEKQLKNLYYAFIKAIHRVGYTCLGRGSKNASE